MELEQLNKRLKKGKRGDQYCRIFRKQDFTNWGGWGLLGTNFWQMGQKVCVCVCVCVNNKAVRIAEKKTDLTNGTVP